MILTSPAPKQHETKAQNACRQEIYVCPQKSLPHHRISGTHLSFLKDVTTRFFLKKMCETVLHAALGVLRKWCWAGQQQHTRLSPSSLKNKASLGMMMMQRPRSCLASAWGKKQLLTAQNWYGERWYRLGNKAKQWELDTNGRTTSRLYSLLLYSVSHLGHCWHYYRVIINDIG